MKVMKKNLFILVSLCLGLAFFSSCSKKYTQDAKGFSEIEVDLKSKFGEDAYYTNISVVYDKNVGNIINLAETKEPASLEMKEWNYLKGAWNQIADVTLEISGGEAKDFMFQLGKDVSLGKVGEMVEASKEKLADEKKIDNAVAKIVSVKVPDNGDKINIFISLEPENGGTSFTFFYDLEGNLTQFNY